MSIITSLLDTDMYKISMQQIAWEYFPNATCTYEFKCRNSKDLTPYIDEINLEIDKFTELTFKPGELGYLGSLSFIDPKFINFLRKFKLNRKNIKVSTENKQLTIKIKGKWVDTILFEVPVLAIVNEIYFKHNSKLSEAKMVGKNRLNNKMFGKEESKFPLTDFGTRRRFSRHWHEQVIKELIDNKDLPNNRVNFVGTSNVYLAKKYQLNPVGTMAHEFLQAAQVLGPSLEDTQKFALTMWLKKYGKDLGIALTDIFGIDVFLKDFDFTLAHLYSGVRHDSGDPFEFANKMVAYYKSLGIDPKTKRLVFSDGLDFDKAAKLNETFKDQIKVSFGIGTNLTNDCGYEPLQIVIKMVTCNNQPTIKLSDSAGKIMCNDLRYIKKVRKMINNKLRN